MQIANDVAEGQKFKESSLSRIPEDIKAFASSNNVNTQSGSGGRKKRRKRATTKSSKRVKKDIFDEL